MSDEKETLRPCPFCGEQPFVHEAPRIPAYWVNCRNCAQWATPKRAAAIERWNRRFPEPQEKP